MTIYNEIQNERDYQQKRWGNLADDTRNEPNDWVAYISKYSTNWFDGGFAPYDKQTVENFRKNMIKVAALAVAAVESLERQGTPFYQEQDAIRQ